MPAAKEMTPKVNRNHKRGLWAITRHDAKSKVEAPVEKAAKLYLAEDVKKPLANRSKPKATKLNKRRICMGAVRKLKKIQIYQRKVERKSLLGNEWRKPACRCGTMMLQRAIEAKKHIFLESRVGQ